MDVKSSAGHEHAGWPRFSPFNPNQHLSMKKNTIQLITLSLALLLTACSREEILSLPWWWPILVFGGGGGVVLAIAQGVQGVHEKKQREGARLMAMHRMSSLPVRKGSGISGRRSSIMPSDILVDIKGNRGFALDARNRRVGILRGQGLHPTMISYRDVLSSEIIVDGETVTKTSRGSQIGGALIGGLALGGVGAIIGGLSGSAKSTEKISKLALMVTINDVRNPVHYVVLLDDGIAHEKSSHAYKNAMGEAQKWHGKIKVLIHQTDQEDRRQEQETAAKTVAVVPQESLADQLAKLGELRDRGILTEAEFASQKAKLLGSG